MEIGRILHFFAEQVGEYSTYACWAAIAYYIGYRLRMWPWMLWPLVALSLFYIPVDYTVDISTANKLEEWSGMLQLMILTIAPLIGFISPRASVLTRRLFVVAIITYAFWICFEIVMWIITPYEWSQTTVDLLFFLGHPERLPDVYNNGTVNPNEWLVDYAQIGLGVLSYPMLWQIWKHERTLGFGSTKNPLARPVKRPRIVALESEDLI